MKSVIHILSVTILVFVGIETGISQQDPMLPIHGRHFPDFASFDTDGDGSITLTEFEQSRAQRIADRSQQGYPMRGLANAPTFEQLDLNQDGVLDNLEWQRHGR
jgi:hypothetical protein